MIYEHVAVDFFVAGPSCASTETDIAPYNLRIAALRKLMRSLRHGEDRINLTDAKVKTNPGVRGSPPADRS